MKNVLLSIMVVYLSASVCAVSWDQSGECMTWLDQALSSRSLPDSAGLDVVLNETIWSGAPDISKHESLLREAYRADEQLRKQIPDENEYVRMALASAHVRHESKRAEKARRYQATMSPAGVHISVMELGGENDGRPLFEVLQRRIDAQQYETYYVDHRKGTIRRFLQRGLQYLRFLQLGGLEDMDRGLWSVLLRLDDAMPRVLCRDGSHYVEEMDVHVSLSADADPKLPKDGIQLSILDSKGMGVKYGLSRTDPRVIYRKDSRRYKMDSSGEVIREIEEHERHMTVKGSDLVYPGETAIHRTKAESGALVERRDISVESVQLLKDWSPRERVSEVLSNYDNYTVLSD